MVVCQWDGSAGKGAWWPKLSTQSPCKKWKERAESSKLSSDLHRYISPPHHAHLHSNRLKYTGNVCMRPCVSSIAPKSKTEQRTQWLNMCFCSHGDASETRYKALPSITTLLISKHSLSCLVFLLVTRKATKEYKLWKMFSGVCGKIMRQSK